MKTLESHCPLMATLNSGILGGFSGKVGPVVGYSWKGINCMRSLALSVNDPRTDEQLMWRERLGVLSTLGTKALPFVQAGFHNQAKSMTEGNVFIAKNIKSVFSGTWPSETLDHSKLVFAAGSLDLPANPAVSVSGANLVFSWTDNSGAGNAQPGDQLMVLAYNPQKAQAANLIGVAARSTASFSYAYPATWAGDNCELYIAFRSDNGTVSDSLYLGSMSL